MSTTAETLTSTVKHVTTLVEHYHRDAPFRAPETVPEWQARLLNGLWVALLQAQGDRALGCLVETIGAHEIRPDDTVWAPEDGDWLEVARVDGAISDPISDAIGADVVVYRADGSEATFGRCAVLRRVAP
jgi:hypothetical protein